MARRWKMHEIQIEYPRGRVTIFRLKHRVCQWRLQFSPNQAYEPAAQQEFHRLKDAKEYAERYFSKPLGKGEWQRSPAD